MFNKLPLRRRSVLLTLPILAIGLFSSGCAFSSASYRYKLTLTALVNGETVQGFNVVEVLRQSTQTGKIVTRVTGEALYLDLGEGRRPLVALLTSQQRSSDGGVRLRWHDMHPTTVLTRAYNVDHRRPDFLEIARDVARQRGKREIAFDDLPDLVTFENHRDPKTVLALDPENVSAALGAGVELVRAEIEVTDEPLTTGLSAKLPWLSRVETQLDGSNLRSGQSLANTLHPYDFVRKGF